MTPGFFTPGVFSENSEENFYRFGNFSAQPHRAFVFAYKCYQTNGLKEACDKQSRI